MTSASTFDLDLTEVRSRSSRVKMAAVYLFAARGYHGTSIRDIARLAGLTNAGVYHFVDSKEGLLVEIMTEGQELLQRVTEASLAAVAEPEDKLAHLVGTLVGAHGKNRMLSFVTDWEIRSLAPGSPAHETIRAMRKGYESLWEEVIAAGVARGRFTAANPRLTKLGLLNMCTGVSAWYRPDGPSGLEEIVRELVDHALAVLAASREGRALASRDVRMISLEAMPSSPFEPRVKGSHLD